MINGIIISMTELLQLMYLIQIWIWKINWKDLKQKNIIAMTVFCMFRA